MTTIGKARELSSWLDRRVLDVCGETIGVVVDMYAAVVSRAPAWLAISTDVPGPRLVVAPVRGASLLGEDVVIAHDRRTLATAPAVPGCGRLDLFQELTLSAHYARQQQRTEPTPTKEPSD